MYLEGWGGGRLVTSLTVFKSIFKLIFKSKTFYVKNIYIFHVLISFSSLTDVNDIILPLTLQLSRLIDAAS